MARPDPAGVRRIACIGAGVIGGAWTAYFLGRGYDVAAWDPDSGQRDGLADAVEAAWPAMARLGLAAGASPDRLTVAPSLAAAVDGAEFIQESAPERLDLKVGLIAEIDGAAAPEAVIASSTSSFYMSDMQAECATPARTVVGHPFNPVYLVPLVEVVGGARTDAAVVDWAADFYRAAGKSVLKLDQELYGFVGNRLQAAMWREALHMIAGGEATVEQIDQAISDGPGLRWAIMGPCLTFHLAGGPGGMAHSLDQFGPSLTAPMCRMEAPPLTAELRQAVIAGCERAAAGRSIDELARERDECLIEIMKVLAAYRAGAEGRQQEG